MAQQRILVIDDEPRMRELIRLYLQSEYIVTEAQDGLDGMKHLHSDEPDLVILDVMMPKLDGWGTLQRIREESSVPVVMLTARGDVPDRVQGLRMGADDYLAKPFDGRELQARVQAILRRANALTEGQIVIKRGNLCINTTEHTASWKQRPLALSPKEFDLLTLMASHPGQAFERGRLLDRVWGTDYDGDARTVDSHVKNLREKLGDGAGMIATVWSVGYRFVEPPNAKA